MAQLTQHKHKQRESQQISRPSEALIAKGIVSQDDTHTISQALNWLLSGTKKIKGLLCLSLVVSLRRENVSFAFPFSTN